MSKDTALEYLEARLRGRDQSPDSEIGTPPLSSPPGFQRGNDNGFSFHDVSRKAQKQMVGLKPPDLSSLVTRLDAELKQGRFGVQGGLPSPLPRPPAQSPSPRQQPMPPPVPPIPGMPKAVPAPDLEDPLNPADLVASATVSALRRREELESRRNPAWGSQSPAGGFTFCPLGVSPPNSPRNERAQSPNPLLSPRGIGQFGATGPLLSPFGSPAPSFVPPLLRGPGMMSPFGSPGGSLQAPPGGGLISPRNGSLRAPVSPMVQLGGRPAYGRSASPGPQAPSNQSFSRLPLADKAREAVSTGAVIPDGGSVKVPGYMQPMGSPWSRRNSGGSTRSPPGGYSWPMRVAAPDGRSPSPRPLAPGPGRASGGRPGQGLSASAPGVAVAMAGLPRWSEAPTTAFSDPSAQLRGTGGPVENAGERQQPGSVWSWKTTMVPTSGPAPMEAPHVAPTTGLSLTLPAAQAAGVQMQTTRMLSPVREVSPRSVMYAAVPPAAPRFASARVPVGTVMKPGPTRAGGPLQSTVSPGRAVSQPVPRTPR